MRTATGCIGRYSNESCALESGMKEDDLCVLIKQEPFIEVLPGPEMLQLPFYNVTVIPNATFDATSDNNFKPLTSSENMYVQSVCGQTNYPRARIVNGMLASRGQFPWVVDAWCTGVLISPRHVLTALHCASRDPINCVPDNSFIRTTVNFGGVCRSKNSECPNGTDMKSVKISRVLYPHDTPVNPHNCIKDSDIAILLLEEDIEFNDYVKPICIGKLDPNNLVDWKSAGYGQIENKGYSPRLRYINTDLWKVSDSKAEIFTRGIKNGNKTTTICSGDSGGPVQASFNQSSRTYLAGIHSRGNACDSTNPYYVSAYVPAFADWICKITGVCAWNLIV
uniref:Peptidase S1 domain-containing protein n=1 Tax=Panagrellus redivivus TaxID=6233 RepID=A0A7E4V509_PANRE